MTNEGGVTKNVEKQSLNMTNMTLHVDIYVVFHTFIFSHVTSIRSTLHGENMVSVRDCIVSVRFQLC